MICLQGGNEFTPACREMDGLLLDAAGGGPVAVLPFAAAPGREYETAGANAVRHFTDLGATDVRVVDPDTPRDALTGANLVVLPGGSPRRLRDAVLNSPLHDALHAAAHDPRRVIMGASAGAMLLCAWTVLPENGLTVADGLWLVPDFAVVPHYDGPRPAWEDALRPKNVDLLGIPECSGVLLDGERVTPVGARAATLIMPDSRDELAMA
jgi:hypothetical protein